MPAASLLCRLGVWCSALLASAVAQAAPAQRIPMDCRLGHGPWQPCTLNVERIGEYWWLQVGEQRLEFRSDGRGRVSLIEAGGSERTVEAVWTAEQDLCWDGVCTRGELPLD